MKALYGGSFDPVHLGHLSVVELAAEAFDTVGVVVLANPQKTTGSSPKGAGWGGVAPLSDTAPIDAHTAQTGHGWTAPS